MTPLFILAAAMTLIGAVAALSLRNLIHCALAVAGAFIGLALIYLELGAQFVGLAQVLVYVGAVAILIVFAILLTRGGEPSEERLISGSFGSGIGVALLVLGCLLATLLGSGGPLSEPTRSDVAAAASVANIGQQLMTEYVLPLEVLGLLLTVALIGGVLIALRPTSTKPAKDEPDSNPSSPVHSPASSGGVE